MGWIEEAYVVAKMKLVIIQLLVGVNRDWPRLRSYGLNEPILSLFSASCLDPYIMSCCKTLKRVADKMM